MNYQDLYYFIKVVENGSLAAASEKIDIPTSTLSRRLIALETDLGFQLVHRTSKSFGLTDAGTKFYSRLKAQINDIEFESENVMSELSGLTGDIKVSAPLSFGRHVVNKWVMEFIKLHPGISVEVLLSNQTIDLVKNGIDIAFRLGNIGTTEWIGRDLGEISYLMVASPRFIRDNEEISEPKHLEKTLSISTSSTPLWRLTGPSGDITIHPHSHYKSNVVSACVDAAIDGLGICLLPKFSVEKHLASGALVEVLPEWQAQRKMLRALYPSRDNLSQKNKVFIEFAMEKAKLLKL